MLNSSAQPTATPRTVLVVEDEPTLATAIAQRITAEGWTARVASDGASAVQAATTLRPDLVIMDIMLPVMDGLEATKRIVAERPVPVLILTARDDEADKVIGLGAGADDYMTKPFSMREPAARRCCAVWIAPRSSPRIPKTRSFSISVPWSSIRRNASSPSTASRCI